FRPELPREPDHAAVAAPDEDPGRRLSRVEAAQQDRGPGRAGPRLAQVGLHEEVELPEIIVVLVVRRRGAREPAVELRGEEVRHTGAQREETGPAEEVAVPPERGELQTLGRRDRALGLDRLDTAGADRDPGRDD